jgi:hypothetical protein
VTRFEYRLKVFGCQLLGVSCAVCCCLEEYWKNVDFGQSDHHILAAVCEMLEDFEGSAVDLRLLAGSQYLVNK